MGHLRFWFSQVRTSSTPVPTELRAGTVAPHAFLFFFAEGASATEA